MGSVPTWQSGDGDAFKDWAAEKSCSPETALWMAVLQRAVHDALVASDYQIRASENDKARDFDPDIIRGEARRWLVADYGDYPRDRELVCLAAGVDPEDVVRMARRRLAELKNEAAPEPKPELTPAQQARRDRKRAANRRHQARRKEAKKAGKSLVEYDEMIARRKAYNRECQKLKERTRQKWLVIAQEAAE